MKVGIDTMIFYGMRLDPFQQLDFVKENELEGIQFGGIRGLSDSLDIGKLREIRGRADSLGLYSHVSVASPNLCVGGGSREDRLAEIRRQIEAAAACGWHELHSALGGLAERYELPVSWAEQLRASTGVIRDLAPVLRDHASRIDLETHGDTTTWELARIAEEVGPDVAGICLDTANVFCFAEDPVAAARRAAPYTHLTHTKDGIIYFSKRGITRQGRPPGEGALDWEQILPILAAHSPDLPLSIEDHKWVFEFPVFEESWHAAQADLTRAEFARVVQIAWQWQRKIIAGECPDPAAYEAIPWAEQMMSRLKSGRDFLRDLLERLGLRR